ncbi:MAG: DUF444 family protein, partial [Nitrospinota bacterium]
MLGEEISSNESEGAFNDFLEDHLDTLVDNILTDGGLENLADRGSDIIVEMDSIEPPRFVYDDESGGDGSGGGKGPGSDSGKIRFTIPFHALMELLKKRLNLPNLIKEGDGKIKEYSDEFRTFGPVGVILDKRRTFKKALKTSVATGVYDPENDKFDILIRKKDRRFKLPERVEKPKYKAAVFYMGDISYSTYGERLELEKRLVNTIQNWLDYNYGVKNVEHRFFVHDMQAYEVSPKDFFNVSNAGGTRAAIVFDLVSKIALSEYDPGSTNFYGFYFGDGEIFEEDQHNVTRCLEEGMRPWFNRIGIVEVFPSSFS